MNLITKALSQICAMLEAGKELRDSFRCHWVEIL